MLGSRVICHISPANFIFYYLLHSLVKQIRRYAKEIYLLSTHSSNVVFILLFFLWNERLLSHLVIAPLVCSRTQAHLSIPKWGASWGKKWLIFSRDLDSDPVFVPRIDDTESVEKSLLHTEANFCSFLTAKPSCNCPIGMQLDPGSSKHTKFLMKDYVAQW